MRYNEYVYIYISCDLLSQLRNRGMFDKHFMEVHSLVLVAYESTLESIPYRCFTLRTFNRIQFHVVLQVKPVVLVWKEQQKNALQTKRTTVLLLSCGTNLKVINMARPFNRSQSSAEVTSQLDLYTAVIFLKGKTCDFPSWLSQTSTGKADKVHR